MLFAILRQAPPSVSAAFALLLISACGSWDDESAARAFAREQMHCFDVHVERTEAHRFAARGCDREADVVCSEGSLNPVCIEVARRGTAGGEAVEHAELETRDDAPDNPPSREEEVTGPGPAELAIRRGLDARSEDVLACVDRASVAVRVNHAADGSVSITLSGDLRNSPEEGCVRAAIGEVHVPGGEAGVVVHLVRSSPRPSPVSTDTDSPSESPPEAAPTLSTASIEELD